MDMEKKTLEEFNDEFTDAAASLVGQAFDYPAGQGPTPSSDVDDDGNPFVMAAVRVGENAVEYREYWGVESAPEGVEPDDVTLVTRNESR